MNNYQDALKFISSRLKFHRDPTLNRMRMFMKALGNPQKDLKMIHVTGTNGKGSVVTYLRNLYQMSGDTVGTFTSPYLVKFNERISVNGKPVSDQTITNLVRQVKPVAKHLDHVLDHGGPTEFEVITAMMFLYFKQHPVDIVIVEVGIGGLYDSTNVILPQISAITTVGFDHMKILGDTLPKIAYQKAGVIKYQRPAVIGRIPQAPLTVIKQQGKAKQSQLSILGKQFQVKRCQPHTWGERFDFRNRDLHLNHLEINLMGDYQIDNAGVAIETYCQQRELDHLPVDPQIIRRALAQTQWAGRFEKVNDQPLVVIDGAHNVPAMKAIRPLLKDRFKGHVIYLILAIFADKQYQPMVKILADIPNVHLILTTFQGPGKRSAAPLSAISQKIHGVNPISFEPLWPKAIKRVVSMMALDDVLLITGSLYFISQVRKLFKQN